ncbi:MAG TPA: hypothetical protein VE090_00870 [Methylomirabilota bacterium]|nr:hypothetical protein [Methylomirabilota bacterium]
MSGHIYDSLNSVPNQIIDLRASGNIFPTTNDYFLRNNFFLATTIGTEPKKTIDIQSGAKCSPFKPFGTWTVFPGDPQASLTQTTFIEKDGNNDHMLTTGAPVRVIAKVL